MRKNIDNLYEFLNKNKNYHTAEILRVAYEVADAGGNFKIYHDLDSSLSLRKIFEMEKGCFGAYFANEEGFGSTLEEFLDRLDGNDLDEDLPQFDLDKIDSELPEEDPEEEKPGMFQKMKDGVSNIAKSVTKSVTNFGKKTLINRILDRPLRKVLNSYEARIIFRHFAEEINEEEKELDGVAIFGNSSIYMIMGILSGGKVAEIYDLCATGSSRGISAVFLSKCIDLCSKIGVKRIQMHTRESSSYSLLNKLNQAIQDEAYRKNYLGKMDRVSQRLNRGGGNYNLSQNLQNLIDKIEKITFGYSTPYLTKMKDPSNPPSEEDAMANPEDHYDEENYYETEIFLK